MYELPIWEEVSRNPKVVWTYCDMCAAGLICPETKRRIQKASEIWASHEALIRDLRPLRCNGKHQRGTLAGAYKGQPRTHLARHWTWEFASRVAAGVAAVIREWHKINHTGYYSGSLPQHTDHTEYHPRSSLHPDHIGYYSGSKSFYPAEFPPHAERERSNRLHWPCPACRTNLSQHDPRHTRHPHDCKFPLTEPAVSCPGCEAGRPRDHVTHTLEPGVCR